MKRGTREAAGVTEVAGVRLTHPDRVLFPEQGLTKLDLARYYLDVAEWVVPLLAGRPLSLVRCPEGRTGECFFQKHPGRSVAPEVPRVQIAEREKTASYAYVESLPDVIALVQVGALELHAWGSRVDDLERPDQLVFDLDPGEGVEWEVVIEVARSLARRLEELGLGAFLRTTGGKGLHVVTPLEPAAGWDEAKEFARGVARAQVADDPRRLTDRSAKAERPGKVFIDYLRNARGATAIASYSTRARRGAPVAVPLRWDEIGPSTPSDRYRVTNVRRRLAALAADPWEDFDAARRPLTADLSRAVAARG